MCSKCERNGDAKRLGTPFSTTRGEGVCCETNWPTGSVNSNTFRIKKKIIDSSLPPVAHISHTLKPFYTFYTKKDTKDGFEKNCLN